MTVHKMKEKINDALMFVNKFVGSLLAVLVSVALTGNAKLGEVISTTESLSKSVSEIHTNVESNTIDLAVIKTRQVHLIKETAEIKPVVFETKDIQSARTKSIDCIDSISDVLGCTIPKNHGELYK